MSKIGFIGLGNMGAPLCERLLLENEVNIFDINKSNLNKMENLGGIVKYELNRSRCQYCFMVETDTDGPRSDRDNVSIY